MTSIAATGTASYQSPLQKLQAELQSEVSSGAIGSSDQGALSSALTDIDSSLQGQPASGRSAPQSSPDDLKSKIDTLIAGEVSSGKLTSDQAAELQKVFSNTFASGGPDGPDAAASGRAGGPHKAGGHHHGGHGGAKGAGGNSPADSTDSSSSTTSASDLLQQFLQSLQDSQSSASSAGYDANGDGSSAASASSALLIDYQS